MWPSTATGVLVFFKIPQINVAFLGFMSEAFHNILKRLQIPARTDNLSINMPLGRCEMYCNKFPPLCVLRESLIGKERNERVVKVTNLKPERLTNSEAGARQREIKCAGYFYHIVDLAGKRRINVLSSSCPVVSLIGPMGQITALLTCRATCYEEASFNSGLYSIWSLLIYSMRHDGKPIHQTIYHAGLEDNQAECAHHDHKHKKG